MKLLPAHDLQLINERMYSRKPIDKYIRKAMEENSDLQYKIDQGVTLLEYWMSQSYYESKNNRLAQLKGLDLRQLVIDVFVGVAYCLQPQLFTSVTSQLAGRLGFSDRVDGITTIAEILAVLCITDVFDLHKELDNSSIVVISRIPLPDKLLKFIEQSQYLPPMVCEPEEITHNYQSGYLTVGSDSVILGKGNHHDGDVCLDVINIQNRVALKLDIGFLASVEEQPTGELDTPKKLQQWHKFKRQSHEVYKLMTGQGNRFYLTHKVDKRGRLYAQGYHISTQGTPYKKAMIELAEEEVVEGVPQQ